MRWLMGVIAALVFAGYCSAATEDHFDRSSAELIEADAVDRARRSYEQRRSAAHSRMPDTLYASTPSRPESPHAFVPDPGAEQKLRLERYHAIEGARSLFPKRSGGADDETAEDVFRDYVSPVVQAKCINCHVAGGVSAGTRVVFVRLSNEDHESINLQVFEDLLEVLDDGASVVLNKIRGVGHGGGIQTPAGGQDYANMERFLTLLTGGEESEQVALTPATLFKGVRLANSRQVLRRAALIFAGRVPTANEYAEIREIGLPKAIRNLMTGPEFREFLVRASNDRLLTDREDGVLDGNESAPFVDYINKSTTFCEAEAMGGDPSYQREWEDAVQYAAVRAPLELIAHIAENDLPYTEILTADYIMANPQAAEAYGATTEFDDSTDVDEFKPSKFTKYYLRDDSRILREPLADSDCEEYIVDPGNLPVDYPHAGVLNSPVFMLRYPTTATNRNRARSRWTYYHFLGWDIEKSASRTTDPEALADTNNPTLINPACTVCHINLDPVGGTFQNYDEEGRYRSAWGGLDSLDGFYRDNPPGGDDFLVEARSWEEREIVSTEGYLQRGDNTVGIKYVNEVNWSHVGIDRLTIRDNRNRLVDSYNLGSLKGQHCGGPQERYYQLNPGCVLGVPVSVPRDGTYTVEVDAWNWDDDRRYPGHLRIWAPGYIYQEGDTWYRGMREPGFGKKLAPNADNSVQWLAQQIVRDKRFSESAVEFWWPAINGSEIVLPPEEAGDADFEGLLLAANAQAAEVRRLSGGFRKGFRGGETYNLKDLLVEMMLSKWFRAEKIPDDDPVRTVALLDAGAKRALTPEELARKTLSLTGVQWGRSWRQPWHRLVERQHSLGREYATLYGGIDSDGITERARDMTAVMAGVAKSHAVEVSCPVVLREFYLLPNAERKLFRGIDQFVTPNWEFGKLFGISASSANRAQTLTVRKSLSAGRKTLRLTFENDFYSDLQQADRNVRLDNVVVRDVDDESIVASYEFENHARNECGGAEGDHYLLWSGGGGCAVEVELEIPSGGTYAVQVVAWGDQAGGEVPKLRVEMESNGGNSVGSRVIKAKLVELFDKMLGVRVSANSTEIAKAYGLFLDVWNRKRVEAEDDDDFFSDTRCDWDHDQNFLQGVVDGYRVRYKNEWGGWHYNWNWDLVNRFWNDQDLPDPEGVARTWTVVLMALMMDQRYLHL